MTALSATLFFIGLLLMGADGDTLTAQAIANISGLILFATSMWMMSWSKTFPREIPEGRK
jgi:hypothetical protein